MIIQNIKKIHERIEKILDSAGLVKGLGLTVDELKDENRLTYWRNFATTKGANEKDSYLVWNIHDITPFIYGDGETINTSFDVKIMLYTRNYSVINEMEKLEETVIKNDCEFLFNAIEFNPEFRAYVYIFDIKGMI